MSQLPCFSDCQVTLRQCLVGIAETEEDNPQECLLVHMGVESGLMNKRAVGDWIVKRERLLQVRPR